MVYILTVGEVHELNGKSTKEHERMMAEMMKLKTLARDHNITVVTETLKVPNVRLIEFVPSPLLSDGRIILTGERYEEMAAQPQKMREEFDDAKNGVCTTIAMTLPIKYWGNEEAHIWGCIHGKCPDCNKADWEHDWDKCEGENFHSHECCDECPVQNICTQEKSWSK